MAENKNPILVTGCSGRIGKKVIEALKGNYSVIGLDVIAPFESTYDWSFIPMDITSEKSVKEAFNIVRGTFRESNHLSDSFGRLFLLFS